MHLSAVFDIEVVVVNKRYMYIYLFYDQLGAFTVSPGNSLITPMEPLDTATIFYVSFCVHFIAFFIN